MKHLLQSLLVAAALLPAAAHAQSYTAKVYKDQNGNRQTVASGGTLRMQAGSVADLSGPTFSTALTGNPLQQVTYQNVTTASANATTPVLASATGRTITVGGGLTVMASGTASGASAVVLKCSGGNAIATFPIATLVDQVPVGPFASAGIITRGAALTQGCPSGEAVLISSTGTLATTTNVFVNLPYTVQ
jgi:hypothetical protein